jgi:hypothetical protein
VTATYYQSNNEDVKEIIREGLDNVSEEKRPIRHPN